MSKMELNLIIRQIVKGIWYSVEEVARVKRLTSAEVSYIQNDPQVIELFS